jgi:hypothetical protein
LKLAVVALLGLVLSAGVAHANPERPTVPHEPPYVDLMTFGVGEVVFEKFGHAAICLRYREPGLDTTCFNFGVSDLHQGVPMLWEFLRGEKEFWVEPLSYAGMLAFYEAEDRDIYVQTLPLTRDQSRELEETLWSSLDGPDSRYHYDHFFENCSTRIRNVLDKATRGALSVGADVEYPMTFRDLGRRGLSDLPALIVLCDFVCGAQLEDTPSLWQAMFHPDILRGRIEDRLGVAPRIVYHRKGDAFHTDGPTGRWPVLAFAVLFALPIAIARARGRVRIGVGAAYAAVLAYLLLAVMPALWSGLGVLSLILPLVFAGAFALALVSERGAIAWATVPLVLWGLLIWTLVIASQVPMLGWNEAMFVLVPFDIVLPFLRPAWRRRYAQVRVSLLVLASLLCAIGVLVQPLWVPILWAFLPLALIAFDVPRANHPQSA